jgi:hypothetical protein
MTKQLTSRLSCFSSLGFLNPRSRIYLDVRKQGKLMRLTRWFALQRLYKPAKLLQMLPSLSDGEETHLPKGIQQAAKDNVKSLAILVWSRSNSLNHLFTLGN